MPLKCHFNVSVTFPSSQILQIEELPRPLQSPMKDNARKTYLGNATYFISLLDCQPLILFVMPIVSLFTLFSLFAKAVGARIELRGWKKMQGALGTANVFSPGWHQYKHSLSLPADATDVVAAIRKP